ncbi:uncharacterized protein LOC119765030 [Culex quinquefasciatus]|uniref:uncharacterized protein LOC119765030 n=1 Tax=Culex quinquefasciatus TaxID=7176 RepID=UPI0018E3A2EE|nr:uncharacterized protein LOC119765030 [Culex quinquefasciatus]
MEAMKDPQRKVNGDEIGFYLFHLAKKVLAKRGSRDVMMVEAGDPKKNITVLFCFSADGDYFPPIVVLPYERFPPDVIQSYPGSWGLGKTKSGWMDTKNFVLYIQKVLYPALVRKRVTFPVLFFVDGHRSHTAFAAADACLKLGIVLIALYPNATRIIQPADVGIFGPLKQSWRKILARMPPNEAVTVKTFADKLLPAMNEAFKPETIKAAFKVCGIEPFDPNAPNYTKCLAKSSEILQTSPGLNENPTRGPNQALANSSSVYSSTPATTESIRPPVQSPLPELVDSARLTIPEGRFYDVAMDDANVAPVQSPLPESVDSARLTIPEGRFYDVTMDDANVAPVQSPLPELVDSARLTIPEGRFYDVAMDDANVAPVQSPLPESIDSTRLTIPEGRFYDVTMEDANVAPVQSTYRLDPELVDSGIVYFPEDVTSSVVDETNMTPVAEPTLPLQDQTNTRPISIADFLTTPPTPKRKGKHINYKIRTNPILTAAERMEELRENERQKEQAKQQKLENARKREQKRADKEVDKRQREETRARKKEERKEWMALKEALRVRKQKERQEKQEAKKKAKQSPDESYVRLR